MASLALSGAVDLDAVIDRIRGMYITAKGLKSGAVVIQLLLRFEFEGVSSAALMRMTGKPDANTTALVQECIGLLSLYADFSEVVSSMHGCGHMPQGLDLVLIS